MTDQSPYPIDNVLNSIRTLPENCVEAAFIETLVRAYRGKWAVPGMLKIARAQHIGLLLKAYCAWHRDETGASPSHLQIILMAEAMLAWRPHDGVLPSGMNPWVTPAHFPELDSRVRSTVAQLPDVSREASIPEHPRLIGSRTDIPCRTVVGPLHQLMVCNRHGIAWDDRARSELENLVGQSFENFTVQGATGHFRGRRNQTLVVSIGTRDTAAVCALGHELRRHFRQEGVGLVLDGVYERLVG